MRIHLATFAIFFSLLISSVLGQAVSQVPAEGDRLKMGYVFKQDVVFNPLISRTEYNDELNDLVFGGGLFARDGLGNIGYGLAMVAKQEDERTWIVTLLPDLKFHDRSPLTASDVIFTYQLYQKFFMQSSRIYMVRYLASAEKIDDMTLRFNLRYPIDNFRETIGSLPILPERYYSQWLDEKELKDFPVIRPVGMGAFIFNRKIDNQIYMDANKQYFRKRPMLDGIDLQLFESYEDLIGAFVNDRVDLIEIDDKNTYRKINQITDDVKYTWVKRDDLKLYYISFNTRRAPFNDINVRRAIGQAVNKNALINSSLPGKAQITSNILSPESPFYFFEADRYRYDPRSTIEILESTGYRRQRNGKRFRDGKELKFDLYFMKGSAFEESLVRLISINLGEVGINIQPRPLRPAEIEERMIEGNYQAILSTFVYDPDNDEQVPRQFYLEELNRVNGYQNFNEDRINVVLDRSEKTFRLNELLPNLQRIQYLLNEYAPCIFLFYENQAYYAINNRLENIKTVYLENQHYQTKLIPKYEWYVPKEKQKY